MQCGIVSFSNCLYCAGLSAGSRNQESQYGRPEFVCDFSFAIAEVYACVDFCIAPFLSKMYLKYL